MKASIITLALTAIFAVGNIGNSFGKIYKNVVEDKEKNTTTITLYEGENDIVNKPLKQYEIKYSDNNLPVEKIVYKWDARKHNWVLSEKYEYLYNSTGHPEALTHCEWDKKTQSWSQEVEYAFYMFDISQELLSLNDTK